MASRTRKLSILIIFIAVFFIQTAASSGSLYAIAQQQNSRPDTNSTNSLLLNEENTQNRLFKQTEESVVTIISLPSSTTVTTPDTQNTTVIESGFLYDNQGHIITTNHALGGSKIINVLFENGNRRTAKVIGSDPLDDIAVLKIVENVSRSGQQPKISLLPIPLMIGNSSNVRIGQPVIAIGNPYGLERTMTAGIVSQTGRLIPATSPVEKFVRDDQNIIVTGPRTCKLI